MSDPFEDLPKGRYGAILADPPWHFQSWAGGRWNGDEKPVFTSSRAPDYRTMVEDEISSLPVAELASEDCVLFMWACWPTAKQAFRIMEEWGFTYKTCAFCWVKADATQIHMFEDEIEPDMLLGYWTRSNSEFCLLGTRGKPKRLHADVRQGIIAPRREHSRKPNGVHQRIERLVAGPYVELFARQKRPGWDVWGNQTDKFKEAAE